MSLAQKVPEESADEGVDPHDAGVAGRPVPPPAPRPRRRRHHLRHVADVPEEQVVGAATPGGGVGGGADGRPKGHVAAVGVAPVGVGRPMALVACRRRRRPGRRPRQRGRWGRVDGVEAGAAGERDVGVGARLRAPHQLRDACGQRGALARPRQTPVPLLLLAVGVSEQVQVVLVAGVRRRRRRRRDGRRRRRQLHADRILLAPRPLAEQLLRQQVDLRKKGKWEASQVMGAETVLGKMFIYQLLQLLS